MTINVIKKKIKVPKKDQLEDQLTNQIDIGNRNSVVMLYMQCGTSSEERYLLDNLLG